MGPLTLTSDNLILKVENESSAKNVLDLYLRNRIVFERFEPTRPSNFYTIDYHATMLRREYNSYLNDNFIRYYIYKSNYPKRIIGSINFNIMRNQNDAYAEIGYKIDALYQNRGIAHEACLMAIDALKKYYNVYKIDARIHPDNAASIKLAGKLGFIPVKYEPKSANVMGEYVDLIRYSMHISNTQ